MQQPFVMREAELDRLDGYLQHSYKGERKTCFIVGEAGSGKTRLVHEFSIESMKKYENLLFLVGACNAQTGIGDSYLPFRQIIHQMLGNNENAGGLVGTDNSKRLRNTLKTSGKALVEVAPELIGTLIPGAGLLAALGKFAAEEFGWFDSLKKVAEESTNKERPIETSQLMFQYTALIREIASEIPLVIVLDDLQWADEASITLLFHLIRELEDSPILFVGMYRPNDIELERNGGRHPLRSMLHEVERYHGDISIDLGQTQREKGRAFIDALLDTEPNRFGESFRQHLFKLTSGHPLFATEIVRNMEEADSIIQDFEGYWVTTPKLDWDNIPARIEAVIKERIDRLDDELQDWLFTASVEGQVFTAQVLANIHEETLRHILRRLSRDLDTKHRLTHEVDEVQLSNGLLFKHAFSHSLFQQYLYSSISNAERRILHRGIAKSLENLYMNDLSLVVTQLSYHYTEAGDTERTIKYLTMATELSMNIGDTKQARIHSTQALKITDDLKNLGTQRGWLHYLLGRCDHIEGTYQLAEQAYAMSIDMLTQANEQILLIRPTMEFGSLLRELGRYSESLEFLQTAYELAIQCDDKMQISATLKRMSVLYREVGNYETGIEMLERAFRISQKINDEAGIISGYNSLAIHERRMGNYDLAQNYYETAITIAEKNPYRYAYLMVLDNLAGLLRKRGMYIESLKMSKKALDLSYKKGSDVGVANRRMTLAFTYYSTQEYKRSKQEVDLAKSLAEKVGLHEARVQLLQLDSLLALRAGKLDEAIRHVSEAHKLEHKLLKSSILTTYLIALALIGDIQEACNKAILAIDASNELIRELPKLYRAHYSRGLAQAALAIISNEDQNQHLSEAIETYQLAIKICHEPGVIRYQQLLLNELKPLDSEAVLTYIYDLLAEFENETV